MNVVEGNFSFQVNTRDLLIQLDLGLVVDDREGKVRTAESSSDG